MFNGGSVSEMPEYALPDDLLLDYEAYQAWARDNSQYLELPWEGDWSKAGLSIRASRLILEFRAFYLVFKSCGIETATLQHEWLAWLNSLRMHGIALDERFSLAGKEAEAEVFDVAAELFERYGKQTSPIDRLMMQGRERQEAPLHNRKGPVYGRSSFAVCLPKERE